MNLIKHKSLQFRSITNAAERGTTIVLSEKQNFITYMNTIADMLDSNKTVYTVDTLILASVTPVSTSNTKISAHANVALKERKKPHHHYLILDIPTNNNQRVANNTIDDDVNEKTQLANTGNFSLYPNPNKGSFKIEIKDTDDTEGLTVITITNLLGQTIFAKTVNTNNSIIDIKDESLFPGVYIVTLSRENKTIGQSKIIIE